MLPTEAKARHIYTKSYGVEADVIKFVVRVLVELGPGTDLKYWPNVHMTYIYPLVKLMDL